MHQSGQTNYLTLCGQAGEAGVEKWTSDLLAMTCAYFEKSGRQMHVELIPDGDDAKHPAESFFRIYLQFTRHSYRRRCAVSLQGAAAQSHNCGRGDEFKFGFGYYQCAATSQNEILVANGLKCYPTSHIGI
jgi:hypothetical protein